MKDLLLEIGVEEVPARFLPRAISDLKEITAKALSDNNVSFGEVRSYATPRRLAVLVTDVADTQADSEREEFGPPKKVAFDTDGKPTKAAMGFAKSMGVGTDELVIKSKGGGEYVTAVVRGKGRPAGEVLPDILKGIVLSLQFPKSMRWGDRELRFVRPIRWLTALFGKDTVSFDIEGIKSSNESHGHRFLAPGPFRLKKPADYVSMLDKHKVTVEHIVRKASISKYINDLAVSVKCTPVPDDELLEHVTHIVEHPVGVLCSFPEAYLALPPELPVIVMKDHQKYFALLDKDEKPSNHFVVISNTTEENSPTVRIGAERVIKARLEDARFYFEEDRGKKLSERVDELKTVTFHEKLGSMHEKTERIKETAERLAAAIKPGVKTAAARAAYLCKADLVTGVVYEFPELQGTMGMHYARLDGEAEGVAEAISEHYLPAYSGGPVPGSDAGAAVALADKLDNISAFFGIGLTPTGSEDPYALRRQALGVIAILREKGYEISIKDALDAALPGTEKFGSKDAKDKIIDFFRQRLENIFEGEGYSHDVVRSVIASSTTEPLTEVQKRLAAVKEFKSDANYNDFLMAIMRARNILKEDGYGKVDEELLKEEAERELWDVLNKIKVIEKLAASDYAGAISELTALTEPINKFFDAVLVMDKDEEVKQNRLALLSAIWSYAARVADFSALEEA